MTYPDHFYEELRIRIASDQIKHEMRKLLPDLGAEEWLKIDRSIDRWPEGVQFELEPIHDFWNFLWGVTRGLKMKSLLFWITAKNVHWTKERIPISEIVATFDVPESKPYKKAPYQLSGFVDFIKKNKKIEEALHKESDYRSARFFSRDGFRVVLFDNRSKQAYSEYSGYYILDGNRRALRSVVKGNDSIEAYVGRFISKEDRWPSDYWFPTGFLRDLTFLSRQFEGKPEAKKILDFYNLLFENFSVVKIGTERRVFKNFERDNIVREYFKEQG